MVADISSRALVIHFSSSYLNNIQWYCHSTILPLLRMMNQIDRMHSSHQRKELIVYAAELLAVQYCFLITPAMAILGVVQRGHIE